MDELFDPYRKWLGIPPEEQPPNHYRLLGIALFETDAEVISHAADRQMAHVRTFQSGQRAALSQQILNELSTAKVCLLTAENKRAYDAQLRRSRGLEPRTSAASLAPPVATPAAVIPPAPVVATPPPTAIPLRAAAEGPQPVRASVPAPAARGASAVAVATPVAVADRAMKEAMPEDAPIMPRRRSAHYIPRVRRRSKSASVVGGALALGMVVVLILIVWSVSEGGASRSGDRRRDPPANGATKGPTDSDRARSAIPKPNDKAGDSASLPKWKADPRFKARPRKQQSDTAVDASPDIVPVAPDSKGASKPESDLDAPDG